MLKTNNLSVFYGKVEALRSVSIAVEQGCIVCIIGSNGAGKSTLLKGISGLVKRKGEVSFCGNAVPSVAHKIVKTGITHVPEGRKIFVGLTVEENLRMGAFLISDKKEVEKSIAEMYELFPVLNTRKKQYAGTLSGGEQQMLAIARGLMSKPKLLLLDEPSLGLAPIIVEEVFDIIKRLKERGITILLVEQNAHKSIAISDYVYVLENGKICGEGTAESMLNSPDIASMYLGGKKDLA